jgi:stress-induced morphogen
MIRRSLQRLLGAKDIEVKLRSSEVLKPSVVEVKDISEGCGSFFRVHVTSAAFAGKPLVQQHRLVNECLREEIKLIHGLTVSTKAE